MSHANPNLLKYSSRSSDTEVKTDVRFNMRHLSDLTPLKIPESPNLSESQKNDMVKLDNAKTETFQNATEVQKEFSFTEVGSSYNLSQIDVCFNDAIPDVLQSSLIVCSIHSYFTFFCQLFGFDYSSKKVTIPISKASYVLDSIFKYSEKSLLTPTDKVNHFISMLENLNLFIAGTFTANSVQNIQNNIQDTLRDSEVESFVFEIKNTAFLPPTTVKADVSLIKNLPGNANPQRKFYLKWAICQRNEIFYPVIIEDDCEAVGLYKSSLFTRFGSINSLILSGSTIHYVCYSSSNSPRPNVVRILEEK